MPQIRLITHQTDLEASFLAFRGSSQQLWRVMAYSSKTGISWSANIFWATTDQTKPGWQAVPTKEEVKSYFYFPGHKGNL